jgi:hypothetical protein
MARAEKKLHKLKSKKSTQKTLNRIKSNSEVLKKLKGI